MQRPDAGDPVRADTARAEGRGVERGDVDEGPVLASFAHRLGLNVDAAVRVAERRHDLGPDFVPAARDRRTERGTEVLRPDAAGGESVERGVEDAGGRAPPAGVDDGDPVRNGIEEDDWDAIRRGDEEKNVWLAGEDCVAGSEDAVPALTRRFFESEDDGAVDLVHADHFRVRRAERFGESAAGGVGIQRSRRQRPPREPGRESRCTGQ